MKLSQRQCFIILFAIVILLSALQLTVGGSSINWWTPNALEKDIIWDIRVPRTLLTWLIASALGLAGAVMQLLLRNPLAEPGIRVRCFSDYCVSLLWLVTRLFLWAAGIGFSWRFARCLVADGACWTTGLAYASDFSRGCDCNHE